MDADCVAFRQPLFGVRAENGQFSRRVVLPVCYFRQGGSRHSGVAGGVFLLQKPSVFDMLHRF